MKTIGDLFAVLNVIHHESCPAPECSPDVSASYTEVWKRPQVAVAAQTGKLEVCLGSGVAESEARSGCMINIAACSSPDIAERN